MKIAFIRRQYTPHGGAERYVENLSRRLVEDGHEIHVFSHYWPVSPGVMVHPVPILSGPGLLKLWSFNNRVKALLDRKKFDVVQSFEKTWCQDIYRAGEGCHREWLLQRKRYESPLNTLGVKINPFHWMTLAMEKRLFEKSDTRFFIANSQRGKKEILNHYRVSPEKIKVIYSAVPPILSPNRLPETKEQDKPEKIILFVGSGFSRKGLYFLLRALPLMGEGSTLRLMVVGRGDLKKAEQLAEKLGVSKKISFIGPVADVAPYYQKAQAFVLPSIYEPFSNACLEAMAFGLPVVTTEMNGAAEDIQTGVNGFTVPDPADPVALSAAIRQALTLDRETVSLTHQRMLTRHTWERHKEELFKLYQCLSEKPVIG
jgi:UDP-glucose:(heptosyl)LPS alpha-1,3-glucosyltransferase